MLKQTILALASLATLSAAILPATTGGALAQAQRPCSSVRCDGGGDPGGGGSVEVCTAPLDYLRRVYVEEIEAVTNPNLVSIVPICLNESIMRHQYNGAGLRIAIADNEAMTEALFRKNFGSEDVIGVRMIADDKVILYVQDYSHRSY
jgi:hypothetical protein